MERPFSSIMSRIRNRDTWCWPAPWLVLSSACAAVFVLLLDRGSISANAVTGASAPHGTIVSQFGLNAFQSGCVRATYFVGLSVGSPIFSLFSQRFTVSRLLGVGFLGYALAEMICGFSVNYGMLLFFRFLVGFQAGPIALLPVLIDNLEILSVNLLKMFAGDIAPPGYTGVWLGILFLFSPVGVAVGYIAAGGIAASLGWKATFWIQAGIAAPFAAFFLLASQVDLTSKHRTDSMIAVSSNGTPATEKSPDEAPTEHSAPLPCRRPASTTVIQNLRIGCHILWEELMIVMRRPTCLAAILGLSFQALYSSTASFWVPKFTSIIYYTPPSSSIPVDYLFGAVLVATGVGGTVMGGVCLDLIKGSLPLALWISAFFMAAMSILGGMAFGVVKSVSVYWGLVSLAEVALFGTLAPAFWAVMRSVPNAHRPFALALAETFSHLFGEITGPPAWGAVIMSLKSNWHLAMALLSIPAAVAAAFFVLGGILAGTLKDGSVAPSPENDSQRGRAVADGASLEDRDVDDAEHR